MKGMMTGEPQSEGLATLKGSAKRLYTIQVLARLGHKPR